MPPKTDLRIVRTHALLRQALIDLLQENDFEKISVQDIVDKAMINRNTFYKYYSGKSDLVGEMIAEFKQMYAEKLSELAKGQSLNEYLKIIVPLIFEHRKTLLALWKIKTRRHHFYDDMHQMVAQSFINKAEQSGKKLPHLNYQAHIYATMILQSAKYCFERNEKVPFINDLKVLKEMLAIMEN